MSFTIKVSSSEMARANLWWQQLEVQWKLAYNEAVFGQGPTLEPPQNDALMMLLIRADTLRFAGPLAMNPNVSMPLTNLSGLVPLYHLRYLSITHMHLTQLRELARFTELRHLFVYDNRITSLEGIEHLTELEELYFQNNAVTDLSPIRGLTKLATLYASNNRLTRLEGLTPQHEKHLKRCYVLPNDGLPDRAILQAQQELGIICRNG